MRILGLTTIALAAGLAFATPGHAQAPTQPAPTAAAPAADATLAAPGAEAAKLAKPADPTLNPDGSHKTGPKPGIGQPVDREIGLQPQVSPNGREALKFHNWVLFPLITVISLFVLALLLWVMVRYRRAANPVPSRTSHNTAIEVIWTLVPVLILVAIAVPSIRLLAHQFTPAPDNAITLKAIGNQWYWSYEYPDHGVSFDANLLKEKGQQEPGQRYRTDVDGPRLLATDNRVVVPVGVPIRLITTATDVIHSWALPAAWIKLDAVPGRLNETSFIIDTPGVYYGQCSELCGARHGYMPITVEAVSPEVFAAWVASKGGHMPEANKPSAAAPAQPGSDKADDTATPANGAGPVENVTATPATTNQAATANPGAGNH
ncbi:cytochrome c oxidase subunit II [Sphingomonas sp. LB-2]|uniref:cytochrome c oxidase subunit II n=1 Tax=Sphingomonas caeni TaxID=2984949 RepID=UPI00222F6030|nr:cytochrome c oxidase subunit II [Sphingomonas caeni]MCW3846388.1 cytochrome c oxidase subunit II [Sphingomonas caeni]